MGFSITERVIDAPSAIFISIPYESFADVPMAFVVVAV